MKKIIYFLRKEEIIERLNEYPEVPIRMVTGLIDSEHSDSFLEFLSEIGNNVPSEEQLDAWAKLNKITIIKK